MAKILLVEDNLALAEAVQEALMTQGHVVEHALEGNEGLDRLKLYFYDLAILDWMLPGITGVEILSRYRAEGGKAPILMLTSKDQISEKEFAFDAGADEYLTKPFNSRELLARVRALMRRPPLVQKKIFECGYLAVDVNARTVTKQGQPVDLAAAEYALLELFIRNQGRIFSSEELLSRVFVSDAAAGDEAVRQRILRLRKKIDAEGLDSPIKTIKGFGYKLEWANS
jgi:OmpR-family two-component system manganese-sensing response regulator